jgi:hypothetical protein
MVSANDCAEGELFFGFVGFPSNSDQFDCTNRIASGDLPTTWDVLATGGPHRSTGN